jgi:hypothetical protein
MPADVAPEKTKTVTYTATNGICLLGRKKVRGSLLAALASMPLQNMLAGGNKRWRTARPLVESGAGIVSKAGKPAGLPHQTGALIQNVYCWASLPLLRKTGARDFSEESSLSHPFLSHLNDNLAFRTPGFDVSQSFPGGFEWKDSIHNGPYIFRADEGADLAQLVSAWPHEQK